MRIARNREELQAALSELTSVGFVPTMGALHAGHGALIDASVRENEFTLVSIFVNPTQFSPKEDLSRYPKPLEEDLALCEARGVNLVFLPTPEVLYPSEEVWVEVPNVSEGLEGASRPTHFRGVATVVAKLLLLVQPNQVYFGLKDLQQCAVVRQLVSGLFLPVSLRFIETVREPSGLALSSRNTYLSEDDRIGASQMHRSLQELAKEISASFNSQSELFSKYINVLSEFGFRVDYLELVDPTTMKPTSNLEGSRLVVAANFGGVRLIDNIPVLGEHNISS